MKKGEMASHNAGRIPNVKTVAGVAKLTAETAATVQTRFDQLEDRLFGEAKIDPGILVRMDDRLSKLESNPAIVIGKMARGVTATVITLGAVFYAVLNFNALVQFLQSLRGR